MLGLRVATHHATFQVFPSKLEPNGAYEALCVCFLSTINELIYEISDFSGVFVNNGFCVMQQLLLSLNPILSGAALESIHLMNNGKFNPGLACSTWLWFSHEEKR